MEWQPQPAAAFVAPLDRPAPLFGVIIPGNPIQTNEVQIDVGRWTVELGTSPESFVVFLTMTVPLPLGYGIALFLAREDTMGFQFVGALTQQRASTLVNVSPIFLDTTQPTRIVLGLALEREEELRNLGQTEAQPLQQAHAATKVAIAERILKDLYSFVASYARSISHNETLSLALHNLPPGDYLVMPTSFVDKWRERLQTKITKDMTFWQ